MDPANDSLPYKAVADISELVCAKSVATDLKLGPNGSLLYAMEFLEKNISWLEQKLKTYKDKYILFDFPGQVELYTHNSCIRNIVQGLIRQGHRVSFFSSACASSCRPFPVSSNILFVNIMPFILLAAHSCQPGRFSLLRRFFKVYRRHAHLSHYYDPARTSSCQRSFQN